MPGIIVAMVIVAASWAGALRRRREGGAAEHFVEIGRRILLHHATIHIAAGDLRLRHWLRSGDRLLLVGRQLRLARHFGNELKCLWLRKTWLSAQAVARLWPEPTHSAMHMDWE